VSSLRSSSREPVSLFAFQDIIFSVTAIMLFAAIWFAISTRVTQFSIAEDLDPAEEELLALSQQLADLEAREIIVQGWISAGRPTAAATPPGSATSAPAVTASPASLLGAAESPATVSALRSLIASEEAEVSRHLLAMQQAESHWAATRRTILELERQSDTFLLAEKADDSLLQPVMILVSTDWIDLEYARRPDLRRRVPGPVDRATILRTLKEFDPARHLLWFGIRPSGAALFDIVRNESRAAGFTLTYEPISETQTVNFHSRERALALLP
jgi:hypothetical protein